MLPWWGEFTSVSSQHLLQGGGATAGGDPAEDGAHIGEDKVTDGWQICGWTMTLIWAWKKATSLIKAPRPTTDTFLFKMCTSLRKVWMDQINFTPSGYLMLYFNVSYLCLQINTTEWGFVLNMWMLPYHLTHDPLQSIGWAAKRKRGLIIQRQKRNKSIDIKTSPVP